MRKFSLLLLAAFAGMVAGRGLAQAPTQSTSRLLPLSVGLSGMLGVESGDPKQTGVQGASSVGVYVESLHYRFRPGLEVRGETGDALGILTGPRVSYWLDHGAVSLYVAALFGPQHMVSNSSVNNQLVTSDVEGITSKGVVGVDLFPPRHLHLGMRVEYSQGTFTGVPNLRPKTILAGIVMRFP